ncbi:hypothetical protein O6H91_12G023300 [Diphasiastrum complanatum]|uniref:Uncharacterized protein n=1 Tax=Diphasiastrum complanatum TaxID=34168 RepID=A0ACC2BZM1_DIPCM|nr:hypothetical protein O6H91_12G023300 [Diphasiastrum complanatum]
MATATGIPDHAAPSARSSNNVENCWDSSAWEQAEVHTDSAERESGEFSADRSVEWVFKPSTWDWDSVMILPGRGREVERRLRSSVCKFPSCTLESSGAGEDHGMNHELDQSLALGNSFIESRGMQGEENGETESSNSRRELDKKASEVEGGQEQRSLASLELGSCSLSSGCNHGVFCGVEKSQKRDPGEAQPDSIGEDHEQRLYLGFGGDSPLDKDKRRARDEEVQSKEVKVEVNADTFIGLKLGKRTYFEDPTGCGIGKAASISPSPAPCPAKKHRVQSQSSQIPRCQVEGCNIDLSFVKDYHRRHKVCDAHSKSPRVVVAGQEQRFCQQCSRFHVLSEFDEDKRSCRRRLAGHNERRRKPQPDTMAVPVAGSVSSFQDHGTWSYGNGPWSRHQSLDDQHGFASKLQILGSERQLLHSALSVSNADRLLMLLQNTKRNMISMSSNISCQGTQTHLKGQMEHTLALSSAPGAEVLAGLPAKQASHSFLGLPDSGCALSLLSSESWAAKSPSSVSFNLSAHTHGGFEQLKVENTHSLPQPQHLLSFHTQEPQADDISTKDLLSMQVQLQSNASAGNKMQARIGGSVDEECQQDPCISASLGPVGHYESHSMLPLLRGQDFENSQHVGAMLNLMQATSSGWQSAQPSSESVELQSLSPRYTEIQSCRPFDLSIFDMPQI